MALIQIYYLPLNDKFNLCVFEKLLSFVPFEKQMKIKRFYFDIDKKINLFSQLLVQYLACKLLNINNQNIRFAYGEYGKPYIVDAASFHYNISHTQNAVVLAVSNSAVGVDIEKVDCANYKIAKRFFTESENRYILEANGDADRRFFEIWTKKEAYIKYIGKGLSIPLNSFDVFDNVLLPKLYVYETDGYIISCCYDEDHIIEVCRIDEDTFVKEYIDEHENWGK